MPASSSYSRIALISPALPPYLTRAPVNLLDQRGQLDGDANAACELDREREVLGHETHRKRSWWSPGTSTGTTSRSRKSSSPAS
jgi:hypothetical protein